MCHIPHKTNDSLQTVLQWNDFTKMHVLLSGRPQGASLLYLLLDLHDNEYLTICCGAHPNIMKAVMQTAALIYPSG